MNSSRIPRLRDHLPELAARSGSAYEKQAQHKVEEGFDRLFWEFGLSVHPHSRGGGPFALAIPQSQFREFFPTGTLAKPYIWKYFSLIGYQRGSGITGASIYPLTIPMQRVFKRTWRDAVQRALAGDENVLRLLGGIVFKNREGPLQVSVTIDPANLDRAARSASEISGIIDSKRSFATLLAIKASLRENRLDLTFAETGTGRLVNPIQNVRRDIRKELFRGWHDYDAQACAPTLLNQIYARATGKESDVIARFVKHKSQLRAGWACEAFNTTEPTEEQVDRIKKAVTALFFGAELVSDNPYKEALTHYLGKSGVERLKRTELRELSAAIRQVFNVLSSDRVTKSEELNLAGKIYNKASAVTKNKLVAHIYQGAERAVLNCFIEYCRLQGIEFVPVHDGFMCEIPIEANVLVNLVRDRTGFEVQLDHEQL